MKTNTIIQSTIAALALAFIPNSPAQNPPPAPAAAKDPFATGKGAAPVPTVKSLSDDLLLLKKRAEELIAARAASAAPAAKSLAEEIPVLERAVKLLTPPNPDTSPILIEIREVSLCYEAFSLPLDDAGALQRSNLTDAGLYEKLAGSAKLERLLVLRAKSGNRAILENTAQYRYPSTYEVEQSLPEPAKADADENKAADEKVKAHAAPLLFAPADFESMNLGDVLEAEATLDAVLQTVELNLSVKHTAQTGLVKWGRGATEVEQPKFEEQKISTAVTAIIGLPRLLGTLNPPFGEGVSSRAEQRVWFCFVTAKLVGK